MSVGISGRVPDAVSEIENPRRTSMITEAEESEELGQVL